MRPSRVFVILTALCLFGAAGFWLRSQPARPSPSAIEASQYPSLQAALDALPETGGLVRLPPGEFELRQPLVLTRGETRIVGAGAATRLINRNETGEPAFIVRHANRPKERGRIWRVELTAFRVSGNPKSGDGVLADGVNELHIRNLSADHNGGHGISLVDCYENPRVADSMITYNGKAGLNLFEDHDIVVSGNEFEENLDAVRAVASYNLCMTGNDIDDHLGNGIVIEETCCSVVSGNMIEESKGAGIIVDRESYAIAISANTLAANNGGGIDLRGAWGTAVSANVLSLLPRNALRIGPNSGRITVTGNNFSNSFVGTRSKRKEDFSYPPPGTSSYASGIVLDNTSDVAVSGNVFAGLIGDAVRKDGTCRRIVVTGNVTTDLNRGRTSGLTARRSP